MKDQSVTEGVRDVQIITPRLMVKANPQRVDVTIAQLALQRPDVINFDPDRGAGRRVAVVLAQVQNAPFAGDLQVERQAGFEAVLPVDREAQEVPIEADRLAAGKHPQDGYDDRRSPGHSQNLAGSP